MSNMTFYLDFAFPLLKLRRGLFLQLYDMRGMEKEQCQRHREGHPDDHPGIPQEGHMGVLVDGNFL